MIARAQETAVLVTTDRVLNEVRRRIEFGMKRPELLKVVDNLAAGILIVPLSALEPLLARSEKTLADAVASRNGSTRDDHVLALA